MNGVKLCPVNGDTMRMVVLLGARLMKNVCLLQLNFQFKELQQPLRNRFLDIAGLALNGQLGQRYRSVTSPYDLLPACGIGLEQR